MEHIKVDSESGIGRILDYVHDRFFQLSDIQYESDLKVFSVPLTVITDRVLDEKQILFLRTWKNPIVESELIVNNVLEYNLFDDANVGEGSINTIDFEGDYVVLRCSAPVELRMKISKLEIELLVSDRVVGNVKRFSFAGHRD